MKYLQKTLLSLIIALAHGSVQTQTYTSPVIEGIHTSNNVSNIFLDIYKERSFESILLVSAKTIPPEVPFDILNQLKVPKVIIGNDNNFEFSHIYNSEIITVIIMQNSWDEGLLASTAQTLNYMRQSRILVVAWNVPMDLQTHFKEQLLKCSELFKMTRVLLILHDEIRNGESFLYLQLYPYPQYHWKFLNAAGPYYPQHWRNMRNKTLITIAEQTIPRIFMFLDEQGKLHLNGYVARLILLFAERFNVTLEMLRPPVLDNSKYYANIDDLLENNLVDIPMSIVTGAVKRWQNNSAAMELTEIKLMVPCPGPFSIKEVYSVILSFHFFVCLITFHLLFSIIHSLIDYLFHGLLQGVNFVLSDKSWPGVLGQSFAARRSTSRALKLLYMMVFLAGFNISIQFGANMKTLFTSPPLHKPIATFDDLNNTPLKVLVVEHVSFIPPQPIKNIVLTNNSIFFTEMRQNFNTSFGYYVSTPNWHIYSLRQLGYTHKVVCIYDNLTIYFALPMAIRLPYNSQYKEALDYLIYRVHDLGLMDAWHTSTFTDMVKMKEISKHHPRAEEGEKILTVNDLYWVWMIFVIGLATATVTFVLELWLGRRRILCIKEM